MTYLSTSKACVGRGNQQVSSIRKGKRTYDATGQPSSHKGKSNKEEETCAPDSARITESLIAAHTVLVDKVDD